MIPKTIDEQMWETLDDISDEAGEFQLDERWLLKYEGWSAGCFPPRLKTEEAMINYAIRQSPKIHKEWNTELTKRGYKALMIGHDEHLGLYGVTYALYRRVTK